MNKRVSLADPIIIDNAENIQENEEEERDFLDHLVSEDSGEEGEQDFRDQLISEGEEEEKYFLDHLILGGEEESHGKSFIHDLFLGLSSVLVIIF